VEGASFLNDVAPALGGGVLFTDTGLDASFAPSGADAIYRLNANGVTTVIANPGLGAPNGIIDTRDGALVVTFMSGEVFRVAAGGNRTVLAGPSQQQLDGVVQLADGRILMSSWGDSCIYEMSPAGAMSCVMSDVEAPADIGADVGRNRVLIPLFNANTVLIRSVP
jgi:sugar lactone lactonase YvrE